VKRELLGGEGRPDHQPDIASLVRSGDIMGLHPVGFRDKIIQPGPIVLHPEGSDRIEIAVDDMFVRHTVPFQQDERSPSPS